MTDQRERYDRVASGYARWWAPVLEPAALALLDLVAADSAAARRIVDVGTGTGTLAVAAARRWPHLEVLAVDASDAMLAGAAAHADARLGKGSPARARVRLAQGFADRLPPGTEPADVVVSSFVYQLVPSRGAALREAFRVLRPGGRLAWVSWLDDEAVSFGADGVLDAALEAVGLEPRGDAEDDGRAGDVPSPSAAAAQMRRAGFRRVSAWSGTVAHDFTPDSWLGFLAEFDEEDLFRSLDPGTRARLERELLRRLRDLDPADLRLELPVVYATGIRPDGASG